MIKTALLITFVFLFFITNMCIIILHDFDWCMLSHDFSMAIIMSWVHP